MFGFFQEISCDLDQNFSHHSLKNWPDSEITKILAIIRQRSLSFTKKLVIDLPKNWSLIRQKIGLSFAKKLVIDSPKFWSLIRQHFGHHSLKFWSSFAKILVIIRRQHWSSFAKKLVFHSPATLVFHSPKFWSSFAGNIGLSFAKKLVVG